MLCLQALLVYALLDRVTWTFIASNGTTIALTEGFYAAKTASALFEGPKARFSLTYKSDTAGYKFDMSITGAQYSLY